VIVHLTTLDRDTELAETVLLRPPRALGIVATALVTLLATGAVWAWYTPIDTIVDAPLRVRSASSPLKDFTAVSGDLVAFAASGVISAIVHREGDVVRPGDVLAELDCRRVDNDIARIEGQIRALDEELRTLADLAQQHEHQAGIELERAQAQVEAADQALAGERDRLALDERRRRTDESVLAIDVDKQRDHATRLQLAADHGAGVAPVELAEAQRQVQAAEARREQAAVPITDAAVRNAEAARRTAIGDLAVVRGRAETARREDDLESRRRQADRDGLARDLANLQLEREHCVLRAPMGGVLTASRIQVGQTVQPGQAAGCIVADDGGFRVDAAIRAADIGLVRRGMRARVKLDTFDFQKYGALDGVIEDIAPDADVAADGTFYIVRIALSGGHLAGGAALRLGMTGRAEIIVRTDRLLLDVVDGVRSYARPQ
jgi:multidrug resistance efflux pump